MAKFIDTQRQDSFVTLIIDRPKVRNSLSTDVVAELGHAIAEIANDTKVRALVITGSGEEAFCAGADLKERMSMDEAQTLSSVKKIQDAFQQIAKLPMPTIAAINGHAFGGGLELALACDMRIASKSAIMGLTECVLGIIPGAGGTQRLAKVVGLARAMELIFLAKKIDARYAHKIGLVNDIANDGDHAKSKAYDMAKAIASNAPLAVRAAKEAMWSSCQQTLAQGLDAELSCYQKILGTEDRLEGLRSFREKRSPLFLGK